MLHRNNEELAVDSGTAEGGLGQIIDFAFGFLRRRWLIILFFTLLGIGAGVTYLRVTPPSYTAKATVMIGTQRAQFVQQQSMFTDSPLDSAQLDSQLQILQSKSIASSVLEKLKLWDDPEFVASSGGSMLGVIRGIFRTPTNPDVPTPKPDAKEAAISGFADQVMASRVGNSYAIEIRFSSRNPEKAAQIANAVA